MNPNKDTSLDRAFSETSDTLRLRGLQFFGRHGTEPWEKEVGRRFIIDVELKLDLSAAAASDSLRDAVDYRAVYAAVRDVVQNESYYLIEAIAGQLIKRLFSQFPAVQALRVQVSKPEAPIGGLNQAAEVEIVRWRKDWTANEADGQSRQNL